MSKHEFDNLKEIDKQISKYYKIPTLAITIQIIITFTFLALQFADIFEPIITIYIILAMLFMVLSTNYYCYKKRKILLEKRFEICKHLNAIYVKNI